MPANDWGEYFEHTLQVAHSFNCASMASLNAKADEKQYAVKADTHISVPEKVNKYIFMHLLLFKITISFNCMKVNDMISEIQLREVISLNPSQKRMICAGG